VKTFTRLVFATVLVCLASAASVFGQAGTGSTAEGRDYWANWFERSDRAKTEQPHWITPLATTTPRLEQEF